MTWGLLIALALGGAVAALNFYLSFVAIPVHRLRHGSSPDRVPSGFPFIGSILLGGVALAAPPAGWVQGLALVLLAVDTGGPHWFVAAQLWNRTGRSTW